MALIRLKFSPSNIILYWILLLNLCSVSVPQDSQSKLGSFPDLCKHRTDSVEFPSIHIGGSDSSSSSSSKTIRTDVNGGIGGKSVKTVNSGHNVSLTGQRKSFLDTPNSGNGPVGALELVCSASYPVQWGFKNYQPWTPWSVSSMRTLSNHNKSSKEIFTSKLKYPRLRNITQIRNDFPTCHKSGDICTQTSVSIGFDGVRSRLATTTGSELIFQPDSEFGKNVNCSLRIAYDKNSQLFYCQGSNSSMNVTIFPRTCSNPVECAKVYMQPNHECITNQPMVPINKCDSSTGCTKMTYSADLLPAIAICMHRSAEDELPNSVALPFFYSLSGQKGLPNSTQEKDPIRYLNWDEVDPQTMLEISTFPHPIFAGEEFSIGCNASYYYFASGLQFEIRVDPSSPNVSVDNDGFLELKTNNMTYTRINDLKDLQEDEEITVIPIPDFNTTETIFTERTTGKSGVETELPSVINLYTKKYVIWKPGKYNVLCKVPVWNSTEWISKSSTVTVLESSIPKFATGNMTETLYYKADTTIDCIASGVPKPELFWTLDGHPVPQGMRIYKGENDTKIWKTLQFPNTAQGVYGNFSCRAKNYAGFSDKTFIVIHNDNSSSTPIIVIAILSVLGLVLIPSVIFLFWKVQKQTKQLSYLTQEEVEEFLLGKPDYIPFQCDMSTYAYYLPYDRSFEIPREDLDIDFNQVLGTGAYGMVIFGRYKDPNLEERVEVAVKTSKPLEDGTDLFKALLSELKIMTYIGKHENIVNLLGACTINIQKREVFIALEFCENGSLLSYMRTHRHTFINPGFVQDDGANGTNSHLPVAREPSFLLENLQVQYVKMEDLSQIAILNEHEYSNMGRIGQTDLLRWAYQIAEGMSYLAYKKVIHGDLAARNVLLTRNLTAKIGDFGLSKRLLHYNTYTRTATTPLPVKWLALECLQDFQFSAESDIWSYGVTLWEIFSLGEIPYSGFGGSGEEFLQRLTRGMRLGQPTFCNPEIFDVMMKCWKHDRKQRPKFSILSQYFKRCLEHPVHTAASLRLSSLMAPITPINP